MKTLLDLLHTCKNLCLQNNPVKLLITNEFDVDSEIILPNSSKEIILVSSDFEELSNIKLALSNSLLKENYVDCEIVNDIIDENSDNELYYLCIIFPKT